MNNTKFVEHSSVPFLSGTHFVQSQKGPGEDKTSLSLFIKICLIKNNVPNTGTALPLNKTQQHCIFYLLLFDPCNHKVPSWLNTSLQDLQGNLTLYKSFQLLLHHMQALNFHKKQESKKMHFIPVS